MFDPDSRDEVRQGSSLLSMAADAPRRRSSGSGRGSSLLALAREQKRLPEDDAAARHGLARSRRNAASSPILNALSGARDNRDVSRADAPGVETNAGRPASRRSLLGRMLDRATGSPAASRGGLGHAEPWETEPTVARHADMPAASRQGEVPIERPAGGDRHGTRPAPVSENYEIWRPLIDPMAVINGVLGSWRLIAFLSVVGAVLGVMIALSTPRLYLSSLELLVDPRDVKIIERNLTDTGLPSDATIAIVENQMRVLTSGTVLARVVDRLSLDNDPEFNGEAGGGFSLRGMFSGLKSLFSSGDGDGGALRHTLAVESLAKSMDVDRSQNTFVIVIGVKTRSADKSALIANTVADVFLQTYGEIQAGVAGRATNEITARLDELRVDLEDAERKVSEFKARNDLVDAQGRLIADDEILKLNDQLAVARARTLELNARAQSSREVNIDTVIGGGALPEELASSTMTELRTRYASLRQQQDRVAVRLGPRHPERIALDAELAGAREQIQAELRRLVASAQTDLKRAVQLEQELAARLAQLKVRQGDFSNERITLRELEREAAAKRTVYEAFLLRARETAEQQGINAANMTVISPATPPLLPSGPSRATIALGGMLLGFMSGVGFGAMGGAWRSLRENSALRSRPEPKGTRQAPSPDDPTSRLRRGDDAVPDDEGSTRPPVRRSATSGRSADGRESWASSLFPRSRRAESGSGTDTTAAAGEQRDVGDMYQRPPHSPYGAAAPNPPPAAYQPFPSTPPQAPAPGWVQTHPVQYPYSGHPVGPWHPGFHAPVTPPVYGPSWVAPGFPPPPAYPFPPAAAPGPWWPASPPPAWPPQVPAAAQPYAGPPAPPLQEPAPRAHTAQVPPRRAEGIDGIRESLREFRQAVESYATHRPRG